MTQPTPSAIKKLTGTYRKDRAPRNEPQPEIPANVPRPPVSLSDSARAEWNRIAPQLHRLGLLTRLDLAALVAYCETFATWVESVERLRADGLLVENEDGLLVSSPWITISNQAASRMQLLLGDFGATPGHRVRRTEAQQTADAYQEFLAG